MAYTFSQGTVDSYNISDNATISITGALTLAAWIKHASGTIAGSNQGIIAKWDAGDRSYALVATIGSPGKIEFTLSSDGSFQAGNVIDSTSTLDTNWHHTACVFNPSAQQSIFFDGVSETSNGSPPAGVFDSAAKLSIATQFDTDANRTFDGTIGEVGVWNTNLTNSEIASLARGFSPRLVRPSNLVVYVPLVRNVAELRNNFTINTLGSPTIAPHPRIIYPKPFNGRKLPTVAAAGGGRFNPGTVRANRRMFEGFMT